MKLSNFSFFLLSASLLFLSSCERNKPPESPISDHDLPPILLVTLDTTRADRVGYSFDGVKTPNLDLLAKEGVVFDRAFATAPMTLPSHTSMMTGLYASEHGVHENARYMTDRKDLLSNQLKKRGYETAAFISAYPLGSQFGLSNGFDIYDDSFPKGKTEKTAREVTNSALSFLESFSKKNNQSPLFLWVHYFDPHIPYEPPEPFLSQYPDQPYLGEIAYMDEQLGRLIDSFKRQFSEKEYRMIVVGDHGEGLGDHGEVYHGNLLYNETIMVPLVIAGHGISPDRVHKPVSIRNVYHTIIEWAGEAGELSLLDRPDEVVCAEAMKPYLQYGWQSQVMAVYGNVKAIQAGGLEVYNLDKDIVEHVDLFDQAPLGEKIDRAIEAYLLPDMGISETDLTEEEQEKLASLGYVSSTGFHTERIDGPDPKDMTHIFADLDLGSGLFVRKKYAEALPVFERILKVDPGNLMVCLRLAVGNSTLGFEDRAMVFFNKAMDLSPESVDLMHYLGLHFFRFRKLEESEALLEAVLKAMPSRLPALQCLTKIKEERKDLEGVIPLYRQMALIIKDDVSNHLKLGDIYMMKGRTQDAIDSFLTARDMMGSAFPRNLDLGVCYLADHQLEEARNCLDSVSPDHPAFSMALLKRAQVSVLLHEPEALSRIQEAYDGGNDMTRKMIRNEALFKEFRMAN